ncbi:MAG: hypothetical protein J1E34_07685 [Oscillospiraceae bacterium]|nr:hypothetical protein [Oscillospiraceae bacterium]
MKGERLFEILGAVDDSFIASAHSLSGKDNIKTMKKNKTIKIVLIAALLAVALSVTAGAAYRFFLPKGLEEEMSFTSENMLKIIDEGKADENSIKIENKSIDTAGFTVTFEAIVQGKVLKTDFTRNLIKGAANKQSSGEKNIVGFKISTQEKTYAVFTLTRNAGGKVLDNPDYNNDVNGLSIGYIIQLKDYIPNANSFIPEFYFYEDAESNVLYLACDITPALPFAGRELKIAVIGHFVGGMDIVDMDNNGYMCDNDKYSGISAIFTLPIDEAYADENAVNEQMKTGTFITREEYESILADSETESADDENEKYEYNVYIYYDDSAGSMQEIGESIMESIKDSHPDKPEDSED